MGVWCSIDRELSARAAHSKGTYYGTFESNASRISLLSPSDSRVPLHRVEFEIAGFLIEIT